MLTSADAQDSSAVRAHASRLHRLKATDELLPADLSRAILVEQVHRCCLYALEYEQAGPSQAYAYAYSILFLILILNLNLILILILLSQDSMQACMIKQG